MVLLKGCGMLKLNKKSNNFFKNNYMVLLIIIMIPIIVHILYSLYSYDELVSKWTAGEMLMYFGTVFTAIIALNGIFNSLNINFKNNINSVRPYIAVEAINIHSRKNIFNNTPLTNKNIETYEEFVISQLCFNICKEKITLNENLQENQMQLIRNNGKMPEELSPGVYAIIQKQFFALFLSCKNVGKGCAVNTNVGLQSLNKKPLFSIPFTFNISNDLVIRIFSECSINEISGMYYLIFRYDDIYGNEYTQKHELIISEDKQKSKFNVKPDIEENLLDKLSFT